MLVSGVSLNARKNRLHTVAPGAISGFVLGFLATLAWDIPILKIAITLIFLIYVSATSVSFLGGLVRKISTKSWTSAESAFKILAGNFALDADRTFFGRVWQGISRYSWELPQSVLGYVFAQWRNITGHVQHVAYFGGATFCTSLKPKTSFIWGLSLGNFIYILHKNPMKNLQKNPLFMHEYGHTFDSQIFGPTYLFAIGVPSISGARFTETRANRHAAKYFKRNHQVSWDGFEKNYPTTG